MVSEKYQDLSVQNSINAKVIGADLLAAIRQAVFDMECPVGTVKEQRPGEPTPAQKYDMGTWTLDTTHNGRTEIGASDDYPLGSTGGSADAILVLHSHQQKEHNNNYAYNAISPNLGGNIGTYSNVILPQGYERDETITGAYQQLMTTQEGESGTGKNMQPYLAINYWKRVA